MGLKNAWRPWVFCSRFCNSIVTTVINRKFLFKFQGYPSSFFPIYCYLLGVYFILFYFLANLKFLCLTQIVVYLSHTPNFFFFFHGSLFKILESSSWKSNCITYLNSSLIAVYKYTQHTFVVGTGHPPTDRHSNIEGGWPKGREGVRKGGCLLVGVGTWQENSWDFSLNAREMGLCRRWAVSTELALFVHRMWVPRGYWLWEKVTRLARNFLLFFWVRRCCAWIFKSMKNPVTKYFGEEYMPLRSMRFGGCRMQTCGQGRVVWLIELLSGRGEFCHSHWLRCLPPN